MAKKKGVTLFEFADSIPRILTIKRLSTPDSHFLCFFEGSTVLKKRKRIYFGPETYGSGSSVEESMKDYVKELRKGNFLVFYDGEEGICIGEFSIPRNLIF
ncbi:MAG: hypothetical protein HZB99_03940 [Candidatus Harrisonbacteria bacterium]|nr:hypothetical protein [Candidatus Harrisonbacteria bacterium]